MHELSLAASIVEAVTETAAAYPGSTVKAVRLRLGALSDVLEDSLRFCWELTVEGTPLAGALLVVTTIPVVVHCAKWTWNWRACRASDVRAAVSRPRISSRARN